MKTNRKQRLSKLASKSDTGFDARVEMPAGIPTPEGDIIVKYPVHQACEEFDIVIDGKYQTPITDEQWRDITALAMKLNQAGLKVLVTSFVIIDPNSKPEFKIVDSHGDVIGKHFDIGNGLQISHSGCAKVDNPGCNPSKPIKLTFADMILFEGTVEELEALKDQNGAVDLGRLRWKENEDFNSKIHFK